jgi:probable HAF family extracellular repeat protein
MDARTLIFGRVLIGFGAAILSGASTAWALPMYRLTDLGDLAGGAYQAIGQDINSQGQVAGWSHGTTGYNAFLWDPAGGMEGLGGLPGGTNTSEALGLNDIGQVVGYAGVAAGGINHAFVWDPLNGMVDLGVLEGYVQSRAVDINESGVAVGYNLPSNRINARAFVWDPNNGMVELTGLPDMVNFSEATGINDSGQIVGSSGDLSIFSRAFLWDPEDGAIDLGSLYGDYSSEATGINNRGQVVGMSSDAYGATAFLWDPVRGMINLRTSDALDYGRAEGINDYGQVVGSAYSYGRYSSVATLWDSGEMYDLNSYLDVRGDDWILTHAFAINNTGEITGYGLYGDGTTHGFLLTPIPEPATLTLLAIGLAGLAGACRRKTPKMNCQAIHASE